jgi:predicted tellurium resistance membrane protein TerC
MLSLLTQPDSWLALATLTLLELVLGIDNLIVLSILIAAAPPALQRRVRFIGLSLALLTRLALLFSIVWLTALRAPLIVLAGHGISPHALILGLGGLALLIKSIHEIQRGLAPVGQEAAASPARGVASLVVQMALLDVVFSLDSVFTAVGLARPDQVLIMAAAIVLSAVAMLWTAAPVARMINRYPTLKIMALAFMVLIGGCLIGQAFGIEVPKGYLYCAIGFALAVELLNLRLR